MTVESYQYYKTSITLIQASFTILDVQFTILKFYCKFQHNNSSAIVVNYNNSTFIVQARDHFFDNLALQKLRS
jgi:hypothetical protein